MDQGCVKNLLGNINLFFNSTTDCEKVEDTEVPVGVYLFGDVPIVSRMLTTVKNTIHNCNANEVFVNDLASMRMRDSHPSVVILKTYELCLIHIFLIIPEKFNVEFMRMKYN